MSKPVIGLVGGIGAGKSAVALAFRGLGAAVIDSDSLAHEELCEPEVVETLRGWWGDSIVDESGKIDRKMLAGVVFESSAELKRLEDLVYPRLMVRQDKILAECDRDPTCCAAILDAPKLFEAGLDELCDAVVFVDAARDARLERLQQTRGWTEEELTRREKLQKPLDYKRARADYTIENNSGLARLESSVKRILALVIASYDP